MKSDLFIFSLVVVSDATRVKWYIKNKSRLKPIIAHKRIINTKYGYVKNIYYYFKFNLKFT